jgi:hypothetical protein
LFGEQLKQDRLRADFALEVSAEQLSEIVMSRGVWLPG